MPAEDPDENPSVARVAGWSLSGWADFGILGGLWALVVTIWARARHNRRHAGAK